LDWVVTSAGSGLCEQYQFLFVTTIKSLIEVIDFDFDHATDFDPCD